MNIENTSDTGSEKAKWSWESYILRLAIATVLGAVISLGFAIFTRSFDQQITHQVYNWGNKISSWLDSDIDQAITVINIAKLAPAPTIKGSVTSRDSLRAILSILDHDDEKLRPVAIGIDIDFGSESGRFNPEDKKFFTFCQDSLRIPVYLGLDRGFQNGRYHWLGLPGFASLAAGVRESTEDPHQHNLRYFTQAGSVSDTLPSLALRIARTGNFDPETTSYPFLRRALPRVDPGKLVGTDKFLVDFSHLKDFGTRIIEFSNLDRPALRKIGPGLVNGKFVILGDVLDAKELTHSRDKFHLDGEDHSGVFKHACAVYTLVSARALIVKEKYGLIFDAGLFVLTFVIYGIATWTGRFREVIPAYITYLTWIIALVICLMAVAILIAKLIFWFDAFFVALALVVADIIQNKAEGVFIHE